MYFLTPSLIHHWKALVNDQSFPMTSGHKLSHGIFKKISFVDPAKRQNFGNASAEKCIPVLRVRQNWMWQGLNWSIPVFFLHLSSGGSVISKLVAVASVRSLKRYLVPCASSPDCVDSSPVYALLRLSNTDLTCRRPCFVKQVESAPHLSMNFRSSEG